MADIILKVTPTELLAKASEMASQKQQLSSIMESCKTEIKSLQGAWKSEAAEQFQNKFNQVYNDIDNMLAIVEAYITTINETASIYERSETTAKSDSESLPTEGVFNV